MTIARVEGVQPMIQLEEFEQVEKAVKKDPRYVEALLKRGITDLSLVCVDPWCAKQFPL